MKRTVLFTTMILSVCLLSCNSDDELKLTKKEGQPSLFENNDKSNMHLSYQNNQITRIKDMGGSMAEYHYENGIPSQIIFSPAKGMIDGNGDTRFIKENDNKIRVESWGEPSPYLHVQEITFDDDQQSVHITDIGSFEYRTDSLYKVREGIRQCKITLDPSTKNILKREEFSLEKSELVATHSYEYDNNPGTMSHIDWPLWLYIYSCESRSTLYDSPNRQFFNYKNNLIKETVDNKAENTSYTVNYTYTHNKNGYPISAANDSHQDQSAITIRY